MFCKWSEMLQFCKCPAGGAGRDNSCVRFTSELSRCCLRTVSVLPLCKLWQSSSPPRNPKYTVASKQDQGKFIYRRRGICFSLNLIKARSGKETLLHCLDRSSIYTQRSSPGRPGEEGGSTRQVSEPSPISPQEKCFECKKEKGKSVTFFPPPGLYL